MRKPGEPVLSGAFISISCTPAEKARWESLIDERGFGSMSGMIRHAMHQLDVGSQATEGER